MNPIEHRKFQEGIANMVLIKEELAQAAYAMYKAYVDAGFKNEEALELTKTLFRGE